MNDSTSCLSGFSILAVDSHPDSLELLKIILTGYGVHVISAATAMEALSILNVAYPDLLISEIHLPEEDGYSLMRKVKVLESKRNVKIPAVALTVCARESDRAKALSAGYAEHLAKPYDIDRLIQTSVQVLNTSKPRQIPTPYATAALHREAV